MWNQLYKLMAFYYQHQLQIALFIPIKQQIIEGAQQNHMLFFNQQQNKKIETVQYRFNFCGYFQGNDYLKVFSSLFLNLALDLNDKTQKLLIQFEISWMKLSTLLLILSILQIIHSKSLNHLTTSQSTSHLMSAKTQHFSSTSGWWAGFIFGPILFFCSLVCIWYNEKRAAIDSRRLALGREICETVDVTSEASARSKENKLVYANGVSRTSAVIGDNLSGVNGPNLIKITRIVEVLEWRRKTRKEGEHQHVYYELEWVSSNSQNEGERFNNPANWFINNDVIYNQQAYLGGYNISKEVADKFCKVIPFTPTMQNAQMILNNTRRNDRVPSNNGQYLYFTPSGPGGYSPAPGGFNPGFGGQPGGQGTLRVQFQLCPTGPLSLIAKSAGPTFSSFNIAEYQGTTSQNNSVPDCCCCCISACYAQLLKPIELLLEVYEENISKDEIFDKAVEKSECFTRVMRILAFVAMVFGIYLLFSPIVNLLGFIPLIGGLISGIVGFAIFLAAFFIAIPIYILAIAISWLVFHPKIGLILLAIGGVILAVVLILGRNKDGDAGSSGAQAHFLALRQLAF